MIALSPNGPYLKIPTGYVQKKRGYISKGNRVWNVMVHEWQDVTGLDIGQPLCRYHAVIRRGSGPRFRIDYRAMANAIRDRLWDCDGNDLEIESASEFIAFVTETLKDIKP